LSDVYLTYVNNHLPKLKKYMDADEFTVTDVRAYVDDKSIEIAMRFAASDGYSFDPFVISGNMFGLEFTAGFLTESGAVYIRIPVDENAIINEYSGDYAKYFNNIMDKVYDILDVIGEAMDISVGDHEYSYNEDVLLINGEDDGYE